MWNGQKADAYVNEGRLPLRDRSGHPGFVPYEAFDTQDAPLLICCGNDRLFAKLATELQRPDWLSDERFATNRARLAHKAALMAQLPGEDFSLTALPLVIDGQRPALRGGAPRLGEHNARHQVFPVPNPSTTQETS